jgi:hypothetical protein
VLLLPLLLLLLWWACCCRCHPPLKEKHLFNPDRHPVKLLLLLPLL